MCKIIYKWIQMNLIFNICDELELVYNCMSQPYKYVWENANVSFGTSCENVTMHSENVQSRFNMNSTARR